MHHLSLQWWITYYIFFLNKGWWHAILPISIYIKRMAQTFVFVLFWKAWWAKPVKSTCLGFFFLWFFSFNFYLLISSFKIVCFIGFFIGFLFFNLILQHLIDFELVFMICFGLLFLGLSWSQIKVLTFGWC